MPQIFHPSMNTISRASIFGAVFILAGVGGFIWLVFRSSYTTQVGVVRPQPVEFSHEHHVSGLGIDCRYCHTSVETSPFAGIPPTATCMTCHSQIWTDSPKLEVVRASYRTGESIPWTRVHDLPDFAYFDHSIHVAKGVGCETCHGRVDLMNVLWQKPTMQMQWCLDCHRQPEKYLRPRQFIFSMDYQPPADQLELGRKLKEEYDVHTRIDCSACHR